MNPSIRVHCRRVMDYTLYPSEGLILYDYSYAEGVGHLRAALNRPRWFHICQITLPRYSPDHTDALRTTQVERYRRQYSLA